MRTIRHQTVNDHHQSGAHSSAARTETLAGGRWAGGDADAENYIIFRGLSYLHADNRLIHRVEQFDPVFSPIRKAVRDEADDLEHDCGRGMGRDPVRVILGRHEAHDVAADHVLAAHAAQEPHDLVDPETLAAGLEVGDRRRHGRVETVQIERDVEGGIAKMTSRSEEQCCP